MSFKFHVMKEAKSTFIQMFVRSLYELLSDINYLLYTHNCF